MLIMFDNVSIFLVPYENTFVSIFLRGGVCQKIILKLVCCAVLAVYSVQNSIQMLYNGQSVC